MPHFYNFVFSWKNPVCYPHLHLKAARSYLNQSCCVTYHVWHSSMPHTLWLSATCRWHGCFLQGELWTESFPSPLARCPPQTILLMTSASLLQPLFCGAWCGSKPNSGPRASFKGAELNVPGHSTRNSCSKCLGSAWQSGPGSTTLKGT